MLGQGQSCTSPYANTLQMEILQGTCWWKNNTLGNLRRITTEDLSQQYSVTTAAGKLHFPLTCLEKLLTCKSFATVDIISFAILSLTNAQSYEDFEKRINVLDYLLTLRVGNELPIIPKPHITLEILQELWMASSTFDYGHCLPRVLALLASKTASPSTNSHLFYPAAVNLRAYSAREFQQASGKTANFPSVYYTK